MKNNYLEFAEHFAARHKLVVCSFDFRHHGRSENAPPTFGEAESWDLAAFLDEADRHGSPKPYILIGESLGAMAAQRLAISDSRISGAVLLHPPAWPWDAVGKALNSWPVVAGAGTLINLAYGRNILAAGDVRQYPAHPEHQPRLLYVMGDQDHYDWKQTRKIYDHWYSGSPATFNEWPAAKPAERKWFVLIPGAQHPDNNPDKFTLLTWPPLIPLLDEFLEIVLH